MLIAEDSARDAMCSGLLGVNRAALSLPDSPAKREILSYVKGMSDLMLSDDFTWYDMSLDQVIVKRKEEKR